MRQPLLPIGKPGDKASGKEEAKCVGCRGWAGKFQRLTENWGFIGCGSLVNLILEIEPTGHPCLCVSALIGKTGVGAVLQSRNDGQPHQN